MTTTPNVGYAATRNCYPVTVNGYPVAGAAYPIAKKKKADEPDGLSRQCCLIHRHHRIMGTLHPHQQLAILLLAVIHRRVILLQGCTNIHHHGRLRFAIGIPKSQRRVRWGD
ncbi:hypothetical protein AMTR_s00169p00039740 [Amborella trichopoda]|uniref:Uncharacterized protein n=1 Tax=Amborella trichopoda TaxID=13333 RepID=W1PJG1_AMBTC|nr:hypothetical protein AMTR_s00169p00039740 [Amborella trichopoda]